MRPLRLTLQAFGPFATTQVVDFRAALEAGLFGIYGQTGAGKSTLFSAMSFALFGTPAKSEQEPRSLRSDHAAPDLPTEVEFIFDLGPKTYLIRRRPAQDRPKSRGTGTTETAAEASLFDVTGIALDSLGPGQSGRVIAEKKVSLVGQQVEALLGYGADQFRQIVLLPQGRFETFLAAKTEARVEILRDLFDVKLYRDLAARLRDQAAEAERTLRDQRALYSARLTERGFDNAQSLTDGIAAAAVRVQQIQTLQAAAETAVQTAQQRLTEAEQIETAFAAAETAQQTLLKLEERTAEIDALATRVQAVQNAKQGRDLEANWQDAIQQTQDAAQSVTKARTDLATATAAKETAASRLKQAQSNDGRRQQIQADLTRLEGIAAQVAQAATLQTALDLATTQDGQAQTALATATATLDALKSRRDAAELGLDQARRSEAERGKLTADLSQANRDLIAAQTYARAVAAVAQAERDLNAAATDLAYKTDAAQTADTTLTEAEARLTRTQAIILAEKLNDDSPCPVCGSHDHPNPAHGTSEHSGLTEAFRAAQRQAQTAAEARVRAESELGNCQARLEDRNRTLAELDQPEQPIEQISQTVADLGRAIANLGQERDLNQLANDFDALRQQVTTAEQGATTARTIAAEASTALAAARATYDTVVAALPDDLRSPQAVTARRSTLERDQQQLTEALDTATRADLAATEALTRTQEQLNAAHQMHAAQALRQTKAESVFHARLTQVGLDVAGYQALQVHFATLDADQRTVTAHRDGLIAARTTWQNAAAACADQTRPDLPPLRDALAEATATLAAANEELASAKTEIASLTRFQASLADALAETERLETETGSLRAVADLTNGKNDCKMTLETFAIGAMFDQVLEAANMRLDPMTRGRYRLTRESEAGAGRGKRGLEIAVHDINTGKARPTATLSGGETFISALALALGLADVVESLSGKIRMDTIFIDEGFGSLDSENGAGTLDQVIQVLADLTQGSRAVGLISHVGLVQDAIPQGFYVRSTPTGSQVEERRGLA